MLSLSKHAAGFFSSLLGDLDVRAAVKLVEKNPFEAVLRKAPERRWRVRQRGRFVVRDQPAHHVAAEDVQQHVEVEVRPLRRAEQLGYVLGPYLALM